MAIQIQPLRGETQFHLGNNQPLLRGCLGFLKATHFSNGKPVSMLNVNSRQKFFTKNFCLKRCQPGVLQEAQNSKKTLSP